MKALKVIGNIFGILFAIILSVALFVMTIAGTNFFAGTALLKGTSITGIIEELFITDDSSGTSQESGSLLEELGIGEFELGDIEIEGVGTVEGEKVKEFIGKVLSNDAGKQLLKLYEDEFNDILGGGNGGNVSPEKIKDIIDGNADSIAEIVQEAIPEADIQTIKDEISKMSGELSNEIYDIVPKGEDIRELLEGSEMSDIFEIFKVINGPTVKLAIGAALFVLALLIYLFRFPRFKGFMWISVVMYVAAPIVAVEGFVIRLGSTVTGVLSFDGLNFVPRLIENFSNRILLEALIILLIGVLFTLLFVFCRKARRKRLAAKSAAENSPEITE